MDRKKINNAAKEAKRFMSRVNAALDDLVECKSVDGSTFESQQGNKGTAALRRASLDLTRALADMRSRS